MNDPDTDADAARAELTHRILNKAAIISGFAAYLDEELDRLEPREVRVHLRRIVAAAAELSDLSAPPRPSTPPISVRAMAAALDAAPTHDEEGAHRLLLVEDDDDHVLLVRSLVTTFRARDAWEVVRAASLEEALRLVGDVNPVCLLVDLGLPDATGLDAVTRLRARAPEHPIVVITASDDDTLSTGALRRGAQDYLVKGRLVGETLERSINHAIERMAVEREFASMALHDGLTGLPNRSLLLDRIEHALDRSARIDALLAVAFIDLDWFKDVNDTYGHAAGDEVLREVARRLHSAVRANDTVARLGGDEFVLLCEDVRDEAEVVTIVEHCLGLLRAPIMGPDGEQILVSSSAGITITAPTATAKTSAETLLAEADAALYAAKGGGRDRCEVHRRSAVTGP